MTYCARIRKVKASKMSGLILVLAVLLVTSGGSAGGSAAFGTPHTWGPASESAQGNAYPVATNGAWDWPQVQRDPQRTGYSPEILGTNFQVAWVHAFQPEKVFPQVQAIIYDGNVFVGTEMGNMYALDAQTGDQEWVYDVGAPILNSVAAGDGKIFFGAMDGAVYALNANTGNLVWRSDLLWRHGFSTAPVLAEDKVLLGGRDGTFYALDPDTGDTLWQYDVGAVILQTAAYNNGRVFFGAMDMRVYAINTADGSPAWQSEKVSGLAFKDYWPVVHQGKVIIRPMGRGGVTDLAACDADPDNCANKTLFVFDEGTGQEAPAVQHSDFPLQHGAMTPPCVDRNERLVVPFGGSWGELDLDSRMVVDSFIDSTGEGGVHNWDETELTSCANNLVFVMHYSEHGGASFTGAFNLDTRMWTQIRPGHITLEMVNNTQGGGGDPPSISNGMIYHVSYYQLIAHSTQPQEARK